MCGIWGGKYGIEGTAKRHWLYSSNRPVLKQLAALAGHMTIEERTALQGGSLVKRVRRTDGSWSWSGDKSKMKASQFLGLVVTFNLDARLLWNESQVMNMNIEETYMLRTYHQRFGSHLSELLKEMANDEHKAREQGRRYTVFSGVLAEPFRRAPS